MHARSTQRSISRRFWPVPRCSRVLVKERESTPVLETFWRRPTSHELVTPLFCVARECSESTELRLPSPIALERVPPAQLHLERVRDRRHRANTAQISHWLPVGRQ